MKIDHVAIWTTDLEKMKEYYTRFFGGTPNNKYRNNDSGFESYFITFASDSAIELMSRHDIPDNMNDVAGKQHKGIIHLAFGVDTMKQVEEKAIELQNAGYKILRGPRKTGDGYWEFETLDPENNRLEVMTKHVV